MIKKIFNKITTAAVLFFAFFPLNLKAQIFGVGDECVADSECDEGYFCSEESGRCQLGEPEKAGVEELGGALRGSGIAETETFADLVFKYVNFALPYLALAAFLGFVYAGFLYVTAYGNDEQIQKSKKIMIYAVIGLIVVILSYSIVQLFTVELVETINPATPPQ
jgi:hypothetical protein